MKVTRFYTGTDNESHFDEVEVPCDHAENIQHPDIMKVGGIFFRDTSQELFYHPSPFHPVSRRQYGIVLKGEMEIGMGDGSKRRFGPGDVFLAEDTTGRGHAIQSLTEGVLRILFIPLE